MTDDGAWAPGPPAPEPTPASGWSAPSGPRVPSVVVYDGAPTTYVAALEAGRPLRVPRWGWGDVGLALLLSIVVPIVIVSAVLIAGLPRTGAVVLLLSLMTPWIGFGLYPILATRSKGNGPVLDLGWTIRPVDLLWGLAGGAGAFVLGGVAAGITEHFTGPFDSAAGEAISNADVGQWVRVAFAVCAVVGAPVFEELCFRGLVFASVAKWAAGAGLRRPVPWATVLAALLFALIHLEPVRIPVLLTIGLVLAVLRARTGRVGASMVAHALNNSVAILSIFGVAVPGLVIPGLLG